jgi:hypothetical protein
MSKEERKEPTVFEFIGISKNLSLITLNVNSINSSCK